MDFNHDGKITSEELLEWSRRGNTIIEKMADIIDKEVYRIWLKGHHNQNDHLGHPYNQPGPYGGGSLHGGSGGPYGGGPYGGGSFGGGPYGSGAYGGGPGPYGGGPGPHGGQYGRGGQYGYDEKPGMMGSITNFFTGGNDQRYDQRGGMYGSQYNQGNDPRDFHGPQGGPPGSRYGTGQAGYGGGVSSSPSYGDGYGAGCGGGGGYGAGGGSRYGTGGNYTGGGQDSYGRGGDRSFGRGH